MTAKPKQTLVDFDEWLLNIHDVFLTAQLMRVLMEEQPVVDGAEQFFVSPRGRLERCALRDLHVLVEAYLCAPPAYASELRRLVPC